MVVSTTLWIASASSVELLEKYAPTNLARAIPRFAVIAMRITFVEPEPELIVEARGLENQRLAPLKESVKSVGFSSGKLSGTLIKRM